MERDTWQHRGRTGDDAVDLRYLAAPADGPQSDAEAQPAFAVDRGEVVEDPCQLDGMPQVVLYRPSLQDGCLSTDVRRGASSRSKSYATVAHPSGHGLEVTLTSGR